MESGGTTDQQQTIQKYGSFIAAQLKTGNDPAVVTQKLVGMGVEYGEASQIVQTIQGQMGTQGYSAGQKVVSSALSMAVIGGLMAAIIGGFIWGIIAKITGYEIGFMAVGIGIFCGFGVRILSGGNSGKRGQVIAIISSLIGILVGKYAVFCFLLKDMAMQKYPSIAANISIISLKTFIIFLTFGLPKMCGPIDIIFLILAIRGAMRVAQD